MSTFSIIILTRDKADYTEACLKSLLTTEGGDYEVVIVDNGSTDRTLDLLESMKAEFAGAGSRLRVIAKGENVGCCTGRNEGVAAAAGEYIVFLDNDTMVKDVDWLVRLREVLDSDPQIQIVGPKITYPFEPHWIQCAGAAISKTGRVQFRGRGESRDTPEFNVQRDVQCLISAGFMFPKELFDVIGGLDEAFNPIEFEDFDFCYRARSRGYRVVYVPSVEIHHWESITSDGTPSLPNTYLIIKHGMLFKKRWRHVFEQEDGPPDSETKWKKIEMPSLHGRRIR
ncbi:MAG: glycosyltransferase family 2 protein [Planctomycetes bacterium]|nr:glycosyltransferase family 2 protein [Planctomycetota bacterium]